MDPSVDYVSLHFDWIVKHPAFAKNATLDSQTPYLLVMKTLYLDVWKDLPERNKFAFDFLYLDIKKHKSLDDEIVRMESMFSVPAQKDWCFVTVGFDDKTITYQKIREAVVKLQSIEWGEIHSFVVEKFRKNDKYEIYEHHHIHLMIETKQPKSKVIQFIFQKMQRYIAGKNFVDVKNYKERERTQCEDYIRGIKRESKMECVHLDREWRLKENIPSKF